MTTACPDCGGLVEVEGVKTVMGFLECPRCGVGSPALAWLRRALLRSEMGEGRPEAERDEILRRNVFSRALAVANRWQMRGGLKREPAPKLVITQDEFYAIEAKLRLTTVVRDVQVGQCERPKLCGLAVEVVG